MQTSEALILGLVQGLTEYLPVSSSAHLLLVPKFMKTTEGGLAFDVFLHIGTFLATIIYFWKDWMGILKQPKAVPGSGTLSWVHFIVATIPALVVGGALHHIIEEKLRSPWVTVGTLSLFGILLFLVDRFQKRNDGIAECTVNKIFVIGLVQCLALVPGVSRSGSTITAGRALGFSRSTAARISFLMSMPVTLAAIVYEMRNFNELLNSADGFLPLLVGASAAFFSGILAIHFMIKLLANVSYAVFMLYRVGLAAAVYFVLVAPAQ